MQIVVDSVERNQPAVIHWRPMTDDAFFEFCRMNPDRRVERTMEGDIIVMPPAGGETGYQNSELSAQLRNWARQDGRGRAFDSSTEYILPSGAAYAPDASWVLKSRLDLLTKEQKRKFLPLCPDFVVELMFPSDRLSKAKARMREWIDNGARLGWLLDAARRTVYVYRPGREPEKIVAPRQLKGSGPVVGFVLELGEIWAGL